MSKVIVFSRLFPKGNDREGQQTFFVEKIWKYFISEEKSRINELKYYQQNYYDLFNPISESDVNLDKYLPKLHTIRAGNRWKAGDVFSPRVWIDKPYKSKQLQIAPEIRIKKIYPIEIIDNEIIINGSLFGRFSKCYCDENIYTLANNDGLSIVDFVNWFGEKKFKGQIICWSDCVSY
jgi:hypothetical protein